MLRGEWGGMEGFVLGGYAGFMCWRGNVLGWRFFFRCNAGLGMERNGGICSLKKSLGRICILRGQWRVWDVMQDF